MLKVFFHNCYVALQGLQPIENPSSSAQVNTNLDSSWDFFNIHFMSKCMYLYSFILYLAFVFSEYGFRWKLINKHPLLVDLQFATCHCAFALKLNTVPSVCLRGTSVSTTVVTHSFLLDSSRQSLNRWRYTGLVGNLSLDPDIVIIWVSTSSSSPCFTSQRD